MADKTTAAFFCERVVWWCVLLLASSGMALAYPVSGKVDTVSLKDEVLKEICSARHSSLWNLYKSFHKEYASASQNGAPTAGPISSSSLVTAVVQLGDQLVATNCPSRCPYGDDTMVEWCIRLASSTHNVTTCLPADRDVVSQSPISKLVSQSPISKLFKMEDYLDIEVSPDGGRPKLVVKETTHLHNKALITCIVTTPTCKDLAHTHIYQVIPNKPPLVVRDAPPQQVYFRKGEEVTLKCAFEGGSDVNGVFWFNEENTLIPLIFENPHCESCDLDPTVPKDGALRTAPVRVYSYQKRVSCSNLLSHFISELIIDTRQVNISAGATYTCSGMYQYGTSISYRTSLWTREVLETNKSSVEEDQWTAECRTSYSLANGNPGNVTWGWFYNGKAVSERPTNNTTCSEGEKEVFTTREDTRNSHSIHHKLRLVACGVPYADINKYKCERSTLKN